MAKLGALPAQDIISGAKGIIDFYVHQGTPCCRSWPRSPGKQRAPAVEAQWKVWTDAMRLWNTLDPSVQAAYNTMASGSTMTGRDIMVKMYVDGKSILPYPLTPP